MITSEQSFLRYMLYSTDKLSLICDHNTIYDNYELPGMGWDGGWEELNGQSIE